MEPVTVEVGRRIARRYRLDERLVDADGVQTWLAFDEVLARPVGVHILAADHPRAQDVVHAAQAAARGFDERFLRVLDAAEDGELVYITQEWVTGRNLRDVLIQDGPLEPAQAQALLTEVSEAIADAHLAGLAHLMLSPESVIFGRGGEVKIAGLAVEAALHGVQSDDPGATDARALGALLFAALTARWPDRSAHGLPGVARDNGRLPSPRQVTAGVPAPLDEVVDRALNDPPRHHMVPLTSPAAFVSAVRSLPKQVARRPMVPAMGPSRSDSDTQIQPRISQPETAQDWGPSRGMRFARGLVTLIVAGAVLLLGVVVGMQLIDRYRSENGGGNGNESPSQSGSPGATVAIVAATSFDPDQACPNCNGEEHEDEIPRLFDADPSSTWSTFAYRNGNLLDSGFKPGVGFVLDLGSPQQVGSVTVAMQGAGAIAELRTLPPTATEIPGAGGLPGSVDDFTQVVPATDVSNTFTLSLDQPVETRYLLVWFTKLPPDPAGSQFRAVIGDVKVNG